MSDFPGRVARLAQLRQRLEIARIEADNPDGSVDPTFLGAVNQLRALIQFVDSDPLCHFLTPELHELHIALLDISRGLPVPWLTPKPKAGARPLSVITAE